jgi:hypothetical protein
MTTIVRKSELADRVGVSRPSGATTPAPQCGRRGGNWATSSRQQTRRRWQMLTAKRDGMVVGQEKTGAGQLSSPGPSAP